ncbi:HAMP domain-containing sensor histidine kinase [Metabacillus malikii]|uniref:histidine kinase n=1 Tax=Metabacillus malikii TaxID=1504265 RepID=A0ABT9ZGI9_9BACI|nr:HAMP domain-containing sensor histidine kinase [Metabacillus malikii]MDQ0231399.1 signal transduction histidine kinase [Metabacillus malikii]
MRLVKSLQFKYLLIIFAALLFLPLSIPIVSGLVSLPFLALENDNRSASYQGFEQLTTSWHREAEKLGTATEAEIRETLDELHKKKYPGSQIFWVDKEGNTKDRFSYTENLPDKWTPSYTVKYMKEHHDANPFTVVAFLGNDIANGFMVIEVDRSLVQSTVSKLTEKFGFLYFYVILITLILFIIFSWLFFRNIHKRLLRLSNAMENKSELGIPETVAISKMDEIGQLENSFNQMITELEQSRLREQNEETLRKDLIANLSHDLRTPLTTIRAQLSLVKAEVTTAKGTDALEAIDQKIDFISKLIDNLFSYTLLSAKKYPYNPEKTEMNRFFRTLAANWYPVFEEKGFEIDISIQSEPVLWEIDQQWMERIIENLLQNVLRHASDGKYIGLFLTDNRLTIQDKGTGFKETSEQQGARIGLTIVEVMINEMSLKWSIDTGETGTSITIYQ